jgi:hypothetical protein
MSVFQQTVQAMKLAKKAHHFFAGVPPIVQGAALCELVATHLAGHVVLGDPAATAELRAALLAAFIDTVQQLVPVVDGEIIQPEIKRRTQ